MYKYLQKGDKNEHDLALDVWKGCEVCSGSPFVWQQAQPKGERCLN